MNSWRNIALNMMTVALFMGSVSSALAQGSSEVYVRTGDRYYDQMAYALAIDEYQKAADRGAINEHVIKRLAEGYMRLGNTEQAEHYYSTVVKFQNRNARELFNYAEALKSNEKYNDAEKYMDEYYAAVNDSRKRSHISDYAYKFKMESDRYQITHLDANTEGSDMAPVYLNNALLFSSTRSKEAGIKRVAAYNGFSFLDLFVANIDPSGELSNVQELDGKVNSKLHDGPATVSGDGRTIYFTRNDLLNGKQKKNQKGISTLNIYSATLIDGQWKDIKAFSNNNSECSVGHPALSPDGAKIYFVSDMPGGIGGTDIYVCEMRNGLWSEAKNLGNTVNTQENETFPYVHSNGTLYFASNGHPGLGGLDIFAAQPNTKGQYDMVINMGYPLNSSKNDFGLVMNAEGNGYFSSDRPGGNGSDDLYHFEMYYPLAPSYIVTGVVLDELTGSPLQDVHLTLFENEDTFLDTVTTGKDGKYSFTIDTGKNYMVQGEMSGYIVGEKFLSTINSGAEQIIVRDVVMAKDEGIRVKGVARFLEGNGFVEGLKVSMIDLGNFSVEEFHTDESGDIRLGLAEETDYELLFELPDHFTRSLSINTNGLEAPHLIDLNALMDMRFEPMAIGSPKALEGVIWADQSSRLDNTSKKALGKLVEMLRNNPSVEIGIACHTDSRGNDDANLKLSQDRAETIMRYLTSRSIVSSRIKPVGYGESQLKNHCVNGVECTEEEHKVNRRNEFIVLSY